MTEFISSEDQAHNTYVLATFVAHNAHDGSQFLTCAFCLASLHATHTEARLTHCLQCEAAGVDIHMRHTVQTAGCSFCDFHAQQARRSS